MKLNLKAFGLSVLVTAALVGCATNIEKTAVSKQKHAELEVQQLNDQGFATSRQKSTEYDKPFFGHKVFEREEKTNYPASFYKNFTLVDLAPFTLSELSEVVTGITGVKFHFEPRAGGEAEGEGGGSDDATGGGGGEDSGGSSGSLNPESILYFADHRSDNLLAFIEKVSAKTGMYWRYDGEKVIFDKYLSKTYQVPAFPGTTSLTTQIAGSPTASTTAQTNGGARTEVNTSFDSDRIDVWSDLNRQLSLIGSSDAEIGISQSTSSVVILDSPEKHKLYDRFFDDLIEKMSKQILLKVEVYEITNDNSSDRGVDWNLAFQDSTVSSQIASGTIPDSIQKTVTNTIIDPTNKYNGSQILLRSLERENKVASVTSGTWVTLNGQPIPVKKDRTVSYLATVSTTQNDNGSQTSAEPGTVSEGIVMQILPVMLDGKRISIQASVSLSQIESIETITFSGLQLQTPIVNSRNTVVRAVLKSGQSWAITGLDENTYGRDHRSVVPGTIAAGGRKVSTKNNRRTLILITPILTEI